MKILLLLSIFALNILPTDNNKKGFEPNAKHTGPIYTGKENKQSPRPHDQWGTSQSYPNYLPPHRKQDDCIIS